MRIWCELELICEKKSFKQKAVSLFRYFMLSFCPFEHLLFTLCNLLFPRIRECTLLVFLDWIAFGGWERRTTLPRVIRDVVDHKQNRKGFPVGSFFRQGRHCCRIWVSDWSKERWDRIMQRKCPFKVHCFYCWMGAPLRIYEWLSVSTSLVSISTSWTVTNFNLSNHLKRHTHLVVGVSVLLR